MFNYKICQFLLPIKIILGTSALHESLSATDEAATEMYVIQAYKNSQAYGEWKVWAVVTQV